MKRRNPRMGCRHIAQQISFIFDVHIDKDVVRRILAKHSTTDDGNHGPSWLTFLAHAKDSAWSLDFFRCESLTLRTHWILVVMDLFTRRIIGFGVHADQIDGTAVCRMFNGIVSGIPNQPRWITSDHDPLFEYQRWKANLRILEITEIKTVPCAPLSHPLVERLIGTIRREYLDHVPFWNAVDLAKKLEAFQHYYNEHRVHSALQGIAPVSSAKKSGQSIARLADYRWKSHCRGLYQLPAAA